MYEEKELNNRIMSDQLTKAQQDEINRYWSDETFNGAFVGLVNFKKALKNIGLRYTLSQIRSALAQNTNFVIHQVGIKKFDRRLVLLCTSNGLQNIFFEIEAFI